MGPQIAATDARVEGAPSVRICTVFFLRANKSAWIEQGEEEEGKGNAPLGRLVGDDEADAAVLVGARDEGVRVEEGERLGVLAARVALELLAAHREGLEQACDGDGRASLRTREPVSTRC